LLVLININMK